jgi:hypothetical protein
VSGSSAAESDFSSACSAESRSTGVTAAADGHDQEVINRLASFSSSYNLAHQLRLAMAQQQIGR